LACEWPSAAHDERKDEPDEFAVDLAINCSAVMKAMEQV
jgi:hypothetical protein